MLQQLTGTGLTGLYDAGSTGDRLFLVQPFVPGATLETLLKLARRAATSSQATTG